MSAKRKYEVFFWCYGEKQRREVSVKADSHVDAISKAMVRECLLESMFYNVESELVPKARQ